MLGAAIGAVGSIAGGILGNSAAKEASDQAWKRQKKVLQNQVQWRVADTVAAGLHPLAALGVNPASGPAPAQVFDSGLGQAADTIGQAVSKYQSPETKMATQVALLQLERGKLENDLLRTQIASQRVRLAQQATPGLPVADARDRRVNIPVPGTNASVPVGTPNGAQNVENAWGDIIGDLYGMGYAIRDHWNRFVEPYYQRYVAPADRSVGEMYGRFFRPDMGGPRNRFRYNYPRR